MVDVAARHEKASGQPRLLGAHLVAWTRVEQDAASDLAEILDDALIPVINEGLRVNFDRPVPGEEEFLLPRLDRAGDDRAHDKEQVSFSGSDERAIPIDEMNLPVVADEDIRRVDVRVTENVIEGPGLKLPPQLLCPGEHLPNPRGI